MLISLLILVSFIFYFIFKKKKDSLLQSPNLKSMVFYRDFLVLTMLPYLYYYSNSYYKKHYILKWLNSDIYFIQAAFAATVFIFFFLFSYNILLSTFEKGLSKITADISYSRLLALSSFFSIFSFFVVVFLSYNFNTGIFAFINDISSLQMIETRALLSQGGGLFSVYKIFIKAWVPMLSYLMFYLYLITGILFKFRNKIALIISVIAGLLASVFYIEKAVLFFYLLGFLGIYVYSGKRLKKIYLPLAFVFSIIFVSVMYLLTYGDRIVDLEYLKNILVHRAATQSVGSVMSFEYFSFNDAKGMSGVSNLWAKAFGESFSSPYSDIIKYYVPETAATSGSMSSFVTGEAYALFGVFGVVFSGVVIAVFLSFFEATKSSRPLSIVFVGIYGLYFSHHYVASSFYGFVWPVGLVYNVLPFVVLLFFSLRFRRAKL